MRSFLSRLSSYYRITAIVFLNAVIVTVLINYVSSHVLNFLKNTSSHDSRHLGLFKYKEYDSALEPVYPQMKPAELSRLLRETRSVSLGYEPYVQFKERPYAGRYVNVDAQGFRPISDQAKWPPDHEGPNIMVFGGSTAFGYGVTDDETISSELQRKLRSNLNPQIKVFNLGRCSYIFPQEAVFFERLLASGIVPDLVIFVDGLNDFAHYDGNPGFTKDLTQFMETGEIPPLKRWLSDWPVFRLFKLDQDHEISVETKSDPEIFNAVLNRYFLNKKVVESLAKEFGTKTLFVWQPVPVYKYDQNHNIFKDFNYSRFLPYLRPGYEAMAKEYEQGRPGINFLWLADMQENLKEPLYVDAVHYSARMSGMIAERIAEKIISQGLLN